MIVLFTTNRVPLVVVKQNKKQRGVFEVQTTVKFVTPNCFQDRGSGRLGDNFTSWVGVGWVGGAPGSTTVKGATTVQFPTNY